MNETHLGVKTKRMHQGPPEKCRKCFAQRFPKGAGFAVMGPNLPKLKNQI